MFEAAVASGKPLILDADGLNLLAEHPRPLPQAILTPHPGEAARLLDSTIADVQADRFAAVEELARRYNCVVVLKGSVWTVNHYYWVDLAIGHLGIGQSYRRRIPRRHRFDRRLVGHSARIVARMVSDLRFMCAICGSGFIRR